MTAAPPGHRPAIMISLLQRVGPARSLRARFDIRLQRQRPFPLCSTSVDEYPAKQPQYDRAVDLIVLVALGLQALPNPSYRAAAAACQR